MTMVVAVLTILAVVLCFLGIVKTALLLAKIYLAIFILLFLAAFLTGGWGTRSL